MVAKPAKCGVLYSGGLDSAILLAWMLSQGYRVVPIYVQSGLIWESAELRQARRFLAALNHPAVDEMVLLQLPVHDLYGDHWSVTGDEVPAADAPDEDVFLPGRNPLLLVKARLWCAQNDIGKLALGTLQTNPFADASQSFIKSLEHALNLAGVGQVALVTPLAAHDKRHWMAWAERLPLEQTFSCIRPIDGLHCGACNKCAERQAAFGLVGLEDPTPYAQASAVGLSRGVAEAISALSHNQSPPES